MLEFLEKCRDAYDRRKRREREVMDTEYRSVTDTYERVSYFTETSIICWYNAEGLDYAMHWHPAIEIIYCLEEDYTVEFPNETVVLHPNDILVIPAGELHHLCAQKGGNRLIYLLDFDCISKISGFDALMPLMSKPIVITPTTPAGIYRREQELLAEMFTEYANESPMWELVMYGKLFEFLTIYGRTALRSDPTEDVGSFKQREIMTRINKAYEYIDSNFMYNITLEKTALMAGFSMYHFSRLFKECSGQNFYEYLCYKRIKATEELLMNPDLSITEIAIRCGFSSPSTFNRTFRRIKNCTPSEYRDLRKGIV